MDWLGRREPVFDSCRNRTPGSHDTFSPWSQLNGVSSIPLSHEGFILGVKEEGINFHMKEAK